MTGSARQGSWVILGLRVGLETGVVAALAYWGYQIGSSTSTKILIGAGAPLLGFGVWGAVDFHRAGRLSERLRLVEELVISGLAAAAWYAAGQRFLGLVLATLSVTYHGLVYASGRTLLKH